MKRLYLLLLLQIGLFLSTYAQTDIIQIKILDAIEVIDYQVPVLDSNLTTSGYTIITHPMKLLPMRKNNTITNNSFKTNQKSLGNIKGKVTDAETGKSTPFVNVTIEVNGNTVGTSTDFDGMYKLDSVFVGFYTVTFSSVGYDPLKIDSIEVHKDKTTFLDAKLTTRNLCQGVPEIPLWKLKKMQRKAKRMERKKEKQ
ncbi:MAG: carboxypeptidase-like regulatory domain-containing protein [Chitinophagales bacterium]